jgi:hypothetical protein
MKRYFVASLLPLLVGAVTSTAEAVPPTVAAPVSPPTVQKPVQPPTGAIAPAAPQPMTATFQCVQSGGGYATVVGNGVKQATLITWNSTAFGSEFSPQVRCNIVSQKFQTVVARNGGKLRNLILTVGTIGNQTVVCAINQGQYGCNSDNMLFTLNPENAKNPGAALARILQIGNYGSGGPVSETTELPEYNLEGLVDRALSSVPDSTYPESTYTPSAPVMAPTEPTAPVAPMNDGF